MVEIETIEYVAIEGHEVRTGKNDDGYEAFVTDPEDRAYPATGKGRKVKNIEARGEGDTRLVAAVRAVEVWERKEDEL